MHGTGSVLWGKSKISKTCSFASGSQRKIILLVKVRETIIYEAVYVVSH